MRRSTRYAKRLERGRFIWPSATDVVAISTSQLAYMLDGRVMNEAAAKALGR
jgi:transposase